VSEPSAAPASGLSDTLQALHLGPDSALEQTLERYLDLLQRWNATYNLTSVRDRGAMLTQHLADCLAVVMPLRRHLTQGSVLDVGSGGGLPGVVLAASSRELQVTCVDTVGKKAAFVRQVAGELALRNLQAVHARVETLKLQPQSVITSRAFASLELFTRLTERHLAPDGVWMAMKGQVPTEEIAALPNEVEVFHVEHLQVPGLDAQRCLVWMRRRSA
jgi:16S rRNA (guanine527-N7)-methyltransferase